MGARPPTGADPRFEVVITDKRRRIDTGPNSAASLTGSTWHTGLILRPPRELTSHTMIRGSYREAAGTVKVGALTIDADAIIGQLTLRTHDTAH